MANLEKIEKKIESPTIADLKENKKELSIKEAEYYKENLYEVLELFRKTINKDFDDWKDADDWLFSNLNLTEKDVLNIYKGRSMVYVASCKKEEKK